MEPKIISCRYKPFCSARGSSQCLVRKVPLEEEGEETDGVLFIKKKRFCGLGKVQN